MLRFVSLLLGLILLLIACPQVSDTVPINIQIVWSKTQPVAPKFLPVGTQSVKVAVARASAPTIVVSSVILNRIPGASSTSGTIEAPIGNDVFVAQAFSAFDAGGTELSKVEKTQVVAAGQANSVALAFDTPTIALSPSNPIALAGGSTIALSASVTNFTGNVLWTLGSDQGSLSAPTGSSVSYTPPASITAVQTVPVTATLEGTQISTVANIKVTTAQCNSGEPNNSINTATPISIGALVTGGICELSDVDWYTFTLTQAQLVTLDVTTPYNTTGKPFDAYMYLYNQSASGLDLVTAKGNTAYQQYDPKIRILLPPGTYYLIIADSFDGGGIDYTYSLSFDATAAPTGLNFDARVGTYQSHLLDGSIELGYFVRVTALNAAQSPPDYDVWIPYMLPNGVRNSLSISNGYAQRITISPNSSLTSGATTFTRPDGSIFSRNVDVTQFLESPKKFTATVSPSGEFITIAFDPISNLLEYTVSVRNDNYTNYTYTDTFSGTPIKLKFNTPVVASQQLNVYFQAVNFSNVRPLYLPDQQFNMSGYIARITVGSPAVPSVTALTPPNGPDVGGNVMVITGNGLSGTRSVKFGSVEASRFDVVSDTEVRAVPAPGTGSVPVTLTAPGGTSNALTYTFESPAINTDFAPLGILVTQGVQNAGNTVPLLIGKATRAEVFVLARNWTVLPPLRLTAVVGGSSIGSLNFNPPSTPTGTTAVTYAGNIPTDWVKPNVQFFAEVNPSASIAETNLNNNRFPVSGNLGLQVVQMPDLEITWIPMIYNGNIPASDPASLAQLIEATKRIMPVVNVNHRVRAPYLIDYDPSTVEGDHRLLSDTAKLRIIDGSDRYYHGLLAIGTPTNGWGGIAFGWRLAISSAYLGFNTTIAHELGHNFELPHAPCGNPAGIDPNYPYLDAAIGVPGFDLVTNESKDPSTKDLMSYCAPVWISDYNYKKALEYRLTEPTITDRAALKPQPVVIISGVVNAIGQVSLEPLLRVDARAELPQSGDYTLELLNQAGTVVKRVPFKPVEVSDGDGSKVFTFAIPWQDGISSAQVLTPSGRTGARLFNRTDPRTVRIPTVAQRISGGDVEVTWDAARYPRAMFRDGTAGEVIGFGRDGRARVRPQQQILEVVKLSGVDQEAEQIKIE
jgi:IPT/TIG domain/Peptidase M66